MKKVLFIGLCAALAFTSCKSSKNSEYANAYDQAKQNELAQGQVQSSDPIEIAPVTTSTSNSNVQPDETYRSEKVVLATGAEGSLKAFSVVCGSFSSKANAENLRSSLVGEGYNAIVVQNPATGMYRVVCASFDSKQDAAQARAQFKAAHPSNADFQKAWLLYNN